MHGDLHADPGRRRRRARGATPRPSRAPPRRHRRRRRPTPPTPRSRRDPALTARQAGRHRRRRRPGAGDTIAYTFVVTNTGNVTLTGDRGRRPAGRHRAPARSAHAGAAESVDLHRRRYTLTQADVDAGVVDNTATATGTAAQRHRRSPTHRHRHRADHRSPGDRARQDGPASRPRRQRPRRRVTRSRYSFVVTNTGNVTLTGHRRSTDPLVGPVDLPRRRRCAPAAVDHVHGDVHADPGRRRRRLGRQHRHRHRHRRRRHGGRRRPTARAVDISTAPDHAGQARRRHRLAALRATRSTTPSW